MNIQTRMDSSDPRATQFKQAVFAGDSERLLNLFGTYPELSSVIDAPWFHFDTPAIVQAAASQNKTLVDTLLRLGADIDARSAWENGPYGALHSLVDGSTPESLAFAEYLVERGAEIDLHAAAGMGRLDVIREILDREPHRVSEPGPDGATPLHLARDVAVASLLLERGADIDKRCVDHLSTPAMWAAQGREGVMAFLLAKGARPDLFMAAILDDVELAAAVLDREPDAIDARVGLGHDEPHVGNGNKYIWALKGADTPAEVARQRGNTEVYTFLLERSRPGPRLVQASRRGDVEEIDRILEAHPGLLEEMPERAVCVALYGSPEGAAALLARGADPGARGNQAGATALHHAAWRGQPELARVLLEGGADPYLRDLTYSATPLGWANESDQREIMAILLAHAPPDVVDAAWLGDTERVVAILAEQPDLVDGPEGLGVSPLRSAAWCGHTEIVQALLLAGADPWVRHPESGKTALDFARERGHDAIIALLEDA